MISIEDIILTARNLNASDIHMRDGFPLLIRKNGKLEILPASDRMTHEIICIYAQQMLETKNMVCDPLKQDVDFCYATPNGMRHRVNLFRQEGKLSAAIRLLNDKIPTIDDLKLPSVLHTLVQNPRGLILVTGPTGSGKSTTLAAMVDEINTKQHCHILTLEDPVEYKYQIKNCLINQREVGIDVDDFATGLRSALREDPDVILVGEMRDFETIGAALTAAETGHLVFSTLHTIGAANTIDRMIDVFPPSQQEQIRVQLASVLKGVITQQLVPCIDSGRIAATEVMLSTDAICNLIRENKTHQISTSLQTGTSFGMHTLNMSLNNLVRQGLISTETALLATSDKADMQRLLQY